MRIATSTLYDQQIGAIDNLSAQQAQFGNELSTGKQLNVPSDNPTQIAQDLQLRTDIAQGNQSTKNINDATAQLNTVDGALSTLSDIVQKARSLAIEGASDAVSPAQRQNIASQVDGLLNEAIGIGNTQYGGKYVFAGTNAPTTAPIKGTGSPVSAVAFGGNSATQTEQFSNGQNVPLSVSAQQAFNLNASDGSPDIFQSLITLRDTLAKGSVVDASANQVNKAGTVIAVGPAAPPSTLASPSFATPIVADTSGNVSINISSAVNAAGVTFTFAPAAPIADGPPPTGASVIGQINAQTAVTGVSAAFNAKTQRLVLSSQGGQSFQISDVPSPGAANTANFVEAFGLTTQADVVTNLSRQLGDIDHATTALLSARASVGGNLQTLSSLGNATSSLIVSNTAVQSGIEDADIAKVVSEFSQTQTALQAAYGTTTRLESKSLFDFLQ
ncbi:MAG: flagellar hook-associated protein FlgL [Candidatus Eremiobacteraeota bacterium]|nr:flagellar hook-associated protein FlgL [Candidatus Eremiobacteraeota bacterium]